MTLEISLLGPQNLSRDDKSLTLPGYRPMALLAYLLLTGKAHSREQLVNLLFDRPNDPRAALRWTLSKLRKVLGPDSIIADRQKVSFNFDSDYWLDVRAFEDGELDLYRGDLLEGLEVREARNYEAWLLVQRETLRVQYQDGLEQRLAEQQQAGDAIAVEQTALQLLELDNLREEWHRSLMSAFAQQGKFEAALAQYELCQNILREELNLDPSPETAELAKAIKSEQSALYSVLATRSNSTLASSTFVSESSGLPDLSASKASSSQSQEVSNRHWSQMRFLFAAAAGLGLVLLAAGLWTRFGTQTTTAKVEASSPNPQEFAGTTVHVGGPFLNDLENHEASVAQFEQESGINIEFIDYGEDYELILDDIILSGLTPDIIVFPQPGYLADFVAKDEVIDVRTFLDEEYLLQQYSPALLEALMIEGQMTGIWHKSNVKSLVWYPKQAFDQAGYEVPETWDELMALTEQIAADGRTPWCIGIESGAATGWPGTDWIEDILLRTAPPETYDAWVAGELPFNSVEVRKAFAIMGDIWLEDRYVHGGTASITTERFYESPHHLFEEPPGCYFHRQGSFITKAFPEDMQFGEDYDFFFLPPIDAEFGKPVLGAGDVMAMFNDRPEVRETMRFYTTGVSIKFWIEEGFVIAPHRDAPFEWYSSPVNLKVAQILLEADTYRFDGSDLMPGAVGAGSFWQGIGDWVEGEGLDSILQDIDESWPEVE